MSRSDPTTSGAREPTGEWLVVAERSHVGFRVRKMGLYFVKGRFTRMRGSVHAAGDGSLKVGKLEIESASVTTRMPPRDWHLRSGDFLAAARHPIIRVTAAAIEATGEGVLSVPAEIDICGVRRPLPLVAHLHPADDALVLHLHGVLDREQVGVRPRRPVAWIVGREVQLDVELALEPAR